MNRRVLAMVVVLAMVASAGCLYHIPGFSGDVTNETLDAEPSAEYDWGSEYDAKIELQSGSTFTAVYNVSDKDRLRVYETTGYGTEEPKQPRAFRYQYANGTVITGSEFRERGGEIEQTPDEVWIHFTDEMEGGKVAFSGDGSPRRFILQTFVEGSYEVTLPPDYTTDFWLFGHISPRGYEIDTVNDRQRITWEEVTASSILVQAYGERDFWIFVAILLIAIVVGAAGFLHFRRQLEELVERRQMMGIDVEEDETSDGDDDDDDGGGGGDDDGPPPGMR